MSCAPWAYLPLVAIFMTPLLGTVAILQKGKSQHRRVKCGAWHLGSWKCDSGPHLRPVTPLHSWLLQFWSLLVMWNQSDLLNLRKVCLKIVTFHFPCYHLPCTCYCEEHRDPFRFASQWLLTFHRPFVCMCLCLCVCMCVWRSKPAYVLTWGLPLNQDLLNSARLDGQLAVAAYPFLPLPALRL